MAGWRLAGQPFLHRLPEAFDFSTGSGVIGTGVFLLDAQAVQFGLKAVAATAAAGQAGGEDHAVVSQGGGGDSAGGDGGAEGGEHHRAADTPMGGDRQGVAGMVVEEGQDLDVGAACQPVVGEVGLPHLVGQVGLKPDVGGLGALGRLGGDQSCPCQVPADGGR